MRVDGRNHWRRVFAGQALASTNSVTSAIQVATLLVDELEKVEMKEQLGF